MPNKSVSLTRPPTACFSGANSMLINYLLGQSSSMTPRQTAAHRLQFMQGFPTVIRRMTCSGCGQIDSNQTLNDRTYVCDCGLELDRDHNAAINILNKALHTASSAGIYACGDIVRPASNIAGGITETGTKQQVDSVLFV